MSCDAGEVMERFENELDYNYELCSFSNLSVTWPTSKLILQPFRRFTYDTAHSLTLPLLHLRHSSFSNPSFAYPTSKALHLIHLASRPCHGGLKLPDSCVTGEEKPRKNLTQEVYPDRGSNPGPLRDRCSCYRLSHSGGRNHGYSLRIYDWNYSIKLICGFIIL